MWCMWTSMQSSMWPMLAHVRSSTCTLKKKRKRGARQIPISHESSSSTRQNVFPLILINETPVKCKQITNLSVYTIQCKGSERLHTVWTSCTSSSYRAATGMRPQKAQILFVPLTSSVIKSISLLRCPLESRAVSLISTGIHWGECSLSHTILSPGKVIRLCLTLMVCNIPR